MKSILAYLSIICTLSCCVVEAKYLQKRQIYREQVLPHAGGKIPDSAFQVDRLALNKLQKEGIAIPDGFQLEPREFQVYPYNQKTRRPTFHAALKPSSRYTPSVGEYHFNEIPSVETTYAVPQISGHPLSLPPKIPAIPILTNPLKIPNSANLPTNYIGNHQYQQQPAYNIVYDIPQKFYSPVAPQQQQQLAYRRPQMNSAPPRQNYPYVGQGPIEPLIDRPLHWSNFQQDYVTSSLFNDFETFFRDYAHQHRASQYSQRGVRDLENETKIPNSNFKLKNSQNKN